jgi:hypothetical protein
MSATLDRSEVARVLADLFESAMFYAQGSEPQREIALALALSVKQAAHALGVGGELEAAMLTAAEALEARGE